METIIAKKAVWYAGIEYQPGQAFEASDKDAKLLKLIGKAAPADTAVNKTDLPKKTKPEPAQDIDVVTPALRAEYEVLVGKRPFMGWDADELRQKMQEYRTEALRADAPGEYQTRVMRAEE